ncbi:RES domain-containing protein [Microbacterium esteraromaticum]|uniref:RES domain-containing protein n=1 Tax=Microbacterium esteraromaticum TaxID=57043 RepID=A0A939DYS6_9MICO|nr:RES domain-containing protein [Microbacterium esteraromaticum]MBN8206503.1 RES domain-containing protein [Microbacterium esteraromaticum]MBN8416658.1 RES domain-containing protein [Microbacterium esteraromaticum]
MEFPIIGWTDKALCLDHIDDAHLSRRVSEKADERECAFCGRTSPEGTSPFAVNLEHLTEVIYEVAGDFYEDVNNAPVVEGEILAEELDTLTVVYNLIDGVVPDAMLDEVAAEVAGLISEPEYWVEQDTMSYVEFGWESFAKTVKHEARLVLPRVKGSKTGMTPPERLYSFLSALSGFVRDETGLMKTLPKGTQVYRARIERDSWALQKKVMQNPAAELGPAPAGSASAGRMNAQGISLFYTATDAETACAEVVAHSPYSEAVVGEYVLQRPMQIFDLTRVPVRPSIFDETARASYVFIAFFDLFRDAITQPVILDDKHPVDYAPTQVVTEFLRWGTGVQFDGIAWESQVAPGGKNVVLFFGPDTPMRSTTEPAPEVSELWKRTFDDEEPVFLIDPKTVKRYRAERTVRVSRTAW